MTIIGHILIWGGLILVIYRYFKEKEKKYEIENFYYSKYEASKLELIEAVEQKYGEEYAQCVIDNRLWESMPISLLIHIKGNPDEIKESVYSGNHDETWFYGAIPYKYGGQTKYKRNFQVNIRNGKVMSWKDL